MSIGLSVKCEICRSEYVILVKKEDLENYLTNGWFVQKAFPYLNEEDRELLVSRTCGKCWDKMFAVFAMFD